MPNQAQTDPLPPSAAEPATPTPHHYPLPWVVGLRVVGTPHVWTVALARHLMLGRGLVEADAPYVDFARAKLDATALGVSRRHARLEVRAGHIALRDLGSTNGTRLNGRVLTPGQPFPVQHGDTLLLGRLQVQLAFDVLPLEASLRGRPAQRGRVLVAEPALGVQAAYRAGLERAGYEVTSATTLAEAVAALAALPPDVVVMDAFAPDRYGTDAVAVLRHTMGARQVPVLVVAAVGRVRALASGAAAFLEKPLPMERLIRAVDDALVRVREAHDRLL